MKSLSLAFLALTLNPFLPAKDPAEPNWDYLLPPKFHGASISPSGRYLLLEANIPYDYEKDRNLREKAGRLVVNPDDYITRGYVWDLKTGEMNLAGPPDKPGAGQDFGDNLFGTKWSDSETLLMVTDGDFHEYDPSSNKTIRSFNIHGSLRETTPMSLPGSLNETMLFFSRKWSQGFKASLWSYLPSKRKVKPLPAEFSISDVVIRLLHHKNRNALSFLTTFGDELEGYTYSLDQAGDFQTYPLSIPGDWTFYTLDTRHLEEHELLAYRRVEAGDIVVEAKLFDYTKSELGPASLELTLREFEEATHLIKKPVIDELRSARSNIRLSECADPDTVKILSQLETSFPSAEFLIKDASNNPDRLLIRVSAADRPMAWYLYSKQAKQLVKLLEAYPELQEKQLSDTKLLAFESNLEPDGKATFVLSRPAAGARPIGTLVSIEPQESHGLTWEYSRTREYLVAEGFAVVSVKLPWSILLSAAQASSQEEFSEVQNAANTYLRSAMDRASAEVPDLFSQPSLVHFSLLNSAASFFPAIPKPGAGHWATIFLVNPRLTAGLQEMPHSQIITAQEFPFDRLFDATRWSEFAEALPAPSSKEVVVIGRENHNRFFSLTKQINSFKSYAKAEGIDVEVDQFDRLGYKILPYWKQSGSTVVGIADHIKDRKSNFDRNK